MKHKQSTKVQIQSKVSIKNKHSNLASCKFQPLQTLLHSWSSWQPHLYWSPYYNHKNHSLQSYPTNKKLEFLPNFFWWWKEFDFDPEILRSCGWNNTTFPLLFGYFLQDLDDVFGASFGTQYTRDPLSSFVGLVPTASFLNQIGNDLECRVLLHHLAVLQKSFFTIK